MVPESSNAVIRFTLTSSLMGTLIPFLDVKKLQSSNILESDQHHSPSAVTLLMHGCCDCTDSRVRHAPWWAMMVKCLTLGFYQYEHEFISSKDTETLPSDPGLFAYHNSNKSTNSVEGIDGDSEMKHSFGSRSIQGNI